MEVIFRLSIIGPYSVDILRLDNRSLCTDCEDEERLGKRNMPTPSIYE